MIPTETRTEPVAGLSGKRHVLRMNRVVLGFLAVSVGVLWLVDEIGVDVPWRVVTPAALMTSRPLSLRAGWRTHGAGGPTARVR